MPAMYQMAWEPTRRRWWKRYRKTRYVVSCRQLDAPVTKEGSYQAANAWWLAKRVEIDDKLPPHPHAQVLELLSQRLAWAQAHGLEDPVVSVREEHAKVEAGTNAVIDGRQLGPLDVPSMVVGMMTDAIWDDRLSRHQDSPANPDRTVGHQAKLWLAELKGRVDAGQFGAGEYRGRHEWH